MVIHVPLSTVSFLSVYVYPDRNEQTYIVIEYIEYTVQETTCPKSTEVVMAEKCPQMACEFAVSCTKIAMVSIFFSHFT